MHDLDGGTCIYVLNSKTRILSTHFFFCHFGGKLEVNILFDVKKKNGRVDA